MAFFVGAEREFDGLGEPSKANAYTLLDRLRDKTHAEIRQILEPTTDLPNIFQLKRWTDEGGLRIPCAWGPPGVLYVLGVFVKHDNREGNKLLRRHYLPLATRAKSTPL